MQPNCTTRARVITDSSPPTTADSRTMTAPTPAAARSPLAPNAGKTRTAPTVLRDSRNGSPRASRSRRCKRKTDRHEEAPRIARDWAANMGVGATPAVAWASLAGKALRPKTRVADWEEEGALGGAVKALPVVVAAEGVLVSAHLVCV